MSDTSYKTTMEHTFRHGKQGDVLIILTWLGCPKGIPRHYRDVCLNDVEMQQVNIQLTASSHKHLLKPVVGGEMGSLDRNEYFVLKILKMANIERIIKLLVLTLQRAPRFVCVLFSQSLSLK